MPHQMKIISPKNLICMDNYASKYNYVIDLAYARNDNLLFGESIYKKSAQLWLYKDLAEIVFLASKYCFEKHKMRFILYDGLRTTNAQEAMMRTKRALDNPHWLDKPRLLSPSGAGGHPRGMAIDIGLEDQSGKLLDMGCAFDCLSEQAHRKYKHSPKIMSNRKILDNSMASAAQKLNMPLSLLLEEWWDFRLPPKIYECYKPLSDNDLPKHMRLMSGIKKQQAHCSR